MNKRENIVTDDLRKKAGVLGISVGNILIIIFISMISLIVQMSIAKVVPFFIAIPLFVFISSIRIERYSLIDACKILLNYTFLEKQEYSIEDIKELSGFTTEKDKILYFKIPARNVNLMNDSELSNEIDNLTSLLTSLVDEVNIFSYDLEIDLRENIKYNRGLNVSKVNDKQDFFLRSIIKDYEILQNNIVNSEKGFAVRVLIKDKNTSNSIIATLKLNGFELINKKLLDKINSVYLTKEFCNNHDNPINHINFNKNYVKLNDYYIKTIAITKYPKPLNNASLSDLANLSNVNINLKIKRTNYDISKLLNQAGDLIIADGSSNKFAKTLQSKRREKDVSDMFEYIDTKNAEIVLATTLIQINAKSLDELTNLEKEVVSRLKKKQITCSTLPSLQKDGFLAFYPFECRNLNLFDYTLLNYTAYSLYPINHSSSNDYRGVHIGKILNGTDLFLDLAKRDETKLNGNGFVVGASGSGKSTIMNYIAFQSMAQKKKSFFLDPENERYELLNSIGGSYFDVTGGNIKINPLEIRYLGNDEESVKIDLNSNDIILNHISFVKNFYTVYSKELLKKNVDLITHLEIYLITLYKKFGFNTNNDFLKCTDSNDYPTFTDLFTLINENPHKLIDKRELLLNSIYSLTYGTDSLLFNGHTTITDSQYICFGLKNLLIGDKDRKNAAMYNILTYIFSWCSKNRLDTILWIDEIYLFFDKDALFLVEELRNLWKRARKYNLSMWGITQNYNDLMQADLKQVTLALISNSDKKIIMQPGQANEIELIKEGFGLSDTEVKIVRVLKKGNFLLTDGNDKYIINSYNKMIPSFKGLI